MSITVKSNCAYAHDFVFSGFVRYEGKICSYEADNALKSFAYFNDTSLSYHNARAECEQYCLDNLDCWGCTFHCDNECKWGAINECKTIKATRLKRGGVTQKPGKAGQYIPIHF